MRPVRFALREFSISGVIRDNGSIAGAHSQHRVIAVLGSLLQQARLQLTDAGDIPKNPCPCSTKRSSSLLGESGTHKAGFQDRMYARSNAIAPTLQRSKTPRRKTAM